MMARLRLLLSFGLVILVVSACSSPSSTLGELPRTPQANIQQLLQQADSSSNPGEASLLRLSAADQSVRQGNYSQARQIMQRIAPGTLKPGQQIFAYTLLAELELAEQHPEQALAAARQPCFQRLAEMPAEQQIRSHLARARSFEANQQTLSALRERVFMGALLNYPRAIRENQEAIWSLVSILPDNQLQPTGDTDLDGWLKLSSSLRQAGSLSQQKQAINHWRQKHPEHPAARQLPAPLARLLEMTEQPIGRVALLLPLQGKLAPVAQALRNGFLTAHLQAQTNGNPALVTIKLYDSSQLGSLDDFYQQASADGMQLVIGPLEKELVRQLARRPQLPLPTLALNYSDSDTPQKQPPQLFQFGLAAEDEAREIARQAWTDGHRRAIALTPDGEWGTRIRDAFNRTWQELGGSLIAAEPLAPPVAMASQVAKLVKLRNSQGGAETGQSSDFLYLTATPQQAQQLKPTLAYQNARDLPVYATSQVNAANGNRTQYLDLEGIRFTETPWLLNPQGALQQAAGKQWPQAMGSLGRLYAMGADAYLLAPRLDQLVALPSTRLEGLTGILNLDSQQRIVRTLPWAEFHDGQIMPLASPQWQ